MFSPRQLSERGFTLIELMVVVAVMGILSSIGVVNLSGAQASARDAERKTDIASYHLALERYYAANASYPLGDIGNNNTDVSGPAATGIFAAGSPLLNNGFIGDLVKDPSTQVHPEFHYRYLTDNQGLKYVLYAKLEAGVSTWWVDHYNAPAEGSSIEPTAP
jgi:prepilin-type N-terminal cleavage/methylation domain-containing protein